MQGVAAGALRSVRLHQSHTSKQHDRRKRAVKANGRHCEMTVLLQVHSTTNATINAAYQHQSGTSDLNGFSGSPQRLLSNSPVRKQQRLQF